jgi:glyoxylase-like metal-dependent hydrolase (beta-lactamase superfamily II)
MLFTGDTLFANGAVGRTDFEYASFPQLTHSIKKLLTYPAKTRIFAGHGSESSIGKESIFHLDETEKNV